MVSICRDAVGITLLSLLMIVNTGDSLALNHRHISSSSYPSSCTFFSLHLANTRTVYLPFQLRKATSLQNFQLGRGRCNHPAVFMTNSDDESGDVDPKLSEQNKSNAPDKRRADFDNLIDALFEVPDPRLLAGDLLFILIVNFLLQIANEVGDPSFWLAGGFSQPVSIPTTLLALVIRDSKMSICWIIGGLWNRSYSSSAVADVKTSVKTSLEVWVSYCSLRISLELGESFLLSHAPIDGWMLGREMWYTAIVLTFFRYAYGKFWSNRYY